MQMTLTIDDDMLAAARAKAESQQRELAKAISVPLEIVNKLRDESY